MFIMRWAHEQENQKPKSFSSFGDSFPDKCKVKKKFLFCVVAIIYNNIITNVRFIH